MPHNFLTDNFVFCCLSPEQREQLKTDITNPRIVYAFQQNLKAEKHGYRCNVCGKLHPYLRLNYRNTLIDPNSISKLRPKPTACKKAATIFCGDHYYAPLKKTLLKFQLDADLQAWQTDVIPVMDGVCHSVLSLDEQYLATETFGGTLGIYDLCTKQLLAKKMHRKLNGSFLFSEDNRLLYYFKNTIRCWDFLRNREEIIWTVPEEWKHSPTRTDPMIIVCSKPLYNRREKKYLFQLGSWDATYIVSIKDLAFRDVVELPSVPSGSQLVYSEELDQYTLATKDGAFIYDGGFGIAETFSYPRLVRTLNGGGMFPITRFKNHSELRRTFLSPDRKWILLDYFNAVILMERESHELKYCLFSYTGGVSLHMGFLDCGHFWYTWRDTTYIQELPN